MIQIIAKSSYKPRCPNVIRSMVFELSEDIGGAETSFQFACSLGLIDPPILIHVPIEIISTTRVTSGANIETVLQITFKTAEVASL